MILILSQENDKSTDDVIDWIHHIEGSCLRINSGDLYFNNVIKINSTSDSFKILNFNIHDINIVWMRRFHNIEYYTNSLFDDSEVKGIIDVKRSLNYESNAISDYFLSIFSKKKWLTKHKQAYVDKLIALDIAQKLGIDIPNTLISSEINEIEKFYSTFKKIISKPLSNCELIMYGGNYYSNYTSEVNFEELLNSKRIPLTLFQENLDKEFEIRVFYFFGQCYSMAIFSQSDEKTKTDFRIYNFDKPNRNVPYKLEEPLLLKIKELMTLLDLDTGSLDFIKTQDGRMVFLEVNPVGQFGMVSHPCNFYLEKLIANYLIENDI